MPLDEIREALREHVREKRAEQAVEAEIAKPLGLDGLYVGLPADQMHRRARLILPDVMRRGGDAVDRLEGSIDLLSILRGPLTLRDIEIHGARVLFEISTSGEFNWALGDDEPPKSASGDGELVITAANGDKVFGTYEGVMTSDTTFVETMIITGGTGRFVGASGTIDETGWFDLDTGYMEITGRGAIAYDASRRAAMK